jgi:hypothetical protein
MKYYLAGPMSGYPQHNLPLFEAAAKGLREAGLEIVSPAEIDDGAIEEFRQFCLADTDGSKTNIGGGDVVMGLSWGDLLARDVKLIADVCDGVILLPKWHESKGARLEVFVAVSCGKPVFTIVQTPEGEVTNDIALISPEMAMYSIQHGVLQ